MYVLHASCRLSKPIKLVYQKRSLLKGLRSEIKKYLKSLNTKYHFKEIFHPHTAIKSALSFYLPSIIMK